MKLGIRNVSPDLYRQAKVDAAKKGITMGKWISEAMKAKLKK